MDEIVAQAFDCLFSVYLLLEPRDVSRHRGSVPAEMPSGPRDRYAGHLSPDPRRQNAGSRSDATLASRAHLRQTYPLPPSDLPCADRLASGTISHDMVESVLGSLSPDQPLVMQRMHADSLRSRAKEGKTISTEALLSSVTRAKASYSGPHREQYALAIDEMTNIICQRYGAEIPVDEAYRLMKGLEPSSEGPR